MKVKNMTSANGNKIANQFIIEDDNKICFQSYDSMIVTIDHNTNTITIGENWDYSKTTGKYRNMFLSQYFDIALGTKTGLEYWMEQGRIGEYTIVKELA